MEVDIFQLNEKVASSTGFSEKVANLAVSNKSGDVNIFEWKISERALYERVAGSTASNPKMAN